MSDLTPNEIKKALECCMIRVPPFKCEECPLLRGTSNSCIYECKTLAYDLINQYEAKIKALEMDHEQLQIDIINSEMNLNHAQVEIERLQDIIDNGADVCGNCHEKYANKIVQSKSDAIKEFAERLKTLCLDLSSVEWNKKAAPVSWSSAYE